MSCDIPVKATKIEQKTSVIVFGSNTHREIIVENNVVSQPEVVEIETSCVDDSVSGMSHTVLQLCSGRVVCIGDNSKLQFGKEEIKTNFEKISRLKDTRIVGISSGHYHCVAITRDGKLYSWGINDKGQLGHLKCYEPSPVQSIKSLLDHKVIQVACGKNHCLALTKLSKLFSWGDNEFGQLGLGETKVIDTHIPTLISSLETLPVSRIACGENFSLCVSTSGSVFTWGCNMKGQLGMGQLSDNHKFSIHPIFLRSIKDLPVCFAACGLNHTALLTLDGGVFTFGEGSYGQLGYACADYHASPKKVPELMGTTIIQISCGANFTLALAKDSMELYGFGQSDQGQLGVVHNNVDVPSIIKRDSSTYDTYNKKIRKICAGGHHTVILLTDIKHKKEDDFRKYSTIEVSQIAYINEPFCKRISKDTITQEQRTRIFNVFSSMASIASSFRDHSEQNSHFNRNKFKLGIDLDLCSQFLITLREKLTIDELVMLRVHMFENTLRRYRYKDNYPAIESLRALLVLMMLPCHIFNKEDSYEQIHVPIYDCICQLTEVPKMIIESWLTLLPPRHFRKIVESSVFLIKYYVGLIPNGKANVIPKTHQELMSVALEFLKICFTLNERSKIISYSSFYVLNLNDKIDIERNFIDWATSQHGPQFSFCSYPFIFDGRAKTHLLHVEATLFMRNAVLETHTIMLMSFLQAHERESLRTQLALQNLPHNDVINNMINQGQGMSFAVEIDNPSFVIRVNRESILQDTLKQLQTANKKEFKKPLKIQFSNEEAVDDGGLIKEFFLLVIREVMQQKEGLFRCYNESNKCYFQQNVKNKDQAYRCVGQLCGLAIYNEVIVDLHFPLILFKKLLDDSSPPDIDDLIELDPTLGKSLQYILDYNDDNFDEVFGITQEVGWADVNDEMHRTDLVSDGSVTLVTMDNKEQYVMDYVQFMLVDNVNQAINAFKEGFFTVVVGSVIRLFKAVELQEMIGGVEINDWMEVQRLTQYKGAYWRGHKVIKWFWEIFHDLSEDQKKKFLRFLTGCDRAPITGMDNFKIIIQPTNGGDNFFPAAHTCFNLLDLPIYSSIEIMRAKLLVSIENTEGFGLV